MKNYVGNFVRSLGLAAGLAALAAPAYAQATKPKEGTYKNGEDVCFVGDLKNDFLSSALTGTTDGQSIQCITTENGRKVFRTVTNGKLIGFYHYLPDGTPIRMGLVVPRESYKEMNEYDVYLAGYIEESGPEYEAEKTAFDRNASTIITDENFIDTEKMERNIDAAMKKLKN